VLAGCSVASPLVPAVDGGASGGSGGGGGDAGGVADAGDAAANICPVADGIAYNPSSAPVGGTVALSPLAADADQGPSPLAYLWTVSSGSLDDATVINPTFTCAVAGPVTVTVTVTDGACTDAVSAVITCSPAVPPDAGHHDAGHADAGHADAGHHDAGTPQLDARAAGLDAGRPDAAVPPADAGTDAGSGGLEPWPGQNDVTIVDNANVFGQNLSGLFYQPAAAGAPDILWGVQNQPSTVYQLTWNGTVWTPVTTNAWTGGKLIHYPGGAGSPDSEGMTMAELDAPAIVYVSTERDNNNGGVSRLSVLRYDTSATGTSLTATHEWNLTPDLPVAGANLGLEAITWVPDSYLTANGFVDESTGAAYDPTRYANHGTGIFFVGLEANGMVYAFALDHAAGGFQRVATMTTGQPAVMDLSFDRDTGNLWAYCDNTCANKAPVLRLDVTPGSATRGHFLLRRTFDHPSTLPNINNEGIAFAPDAECSGGFKAFFWTDDNNTGGHALRRDSIPCGMFF
jgi:PKD repeat protein